MWESIKAGVSSGVFFAKLNQRLLTKYSDPDTSLNIMGRNAIRFLSMK